MSEAEHKPARFDEEAFDAAVAKPNGWSKVADPVAEIRRMRGDASPGNAAALRVALNGVAAELETMNPRGWGGTLAAIRAALSAPARNADLYKNWETALPAWAMETGEEVDSKTGFRDNAQLKRFLDWLFAEAEGGDHA